MKIEIPKITLNAFKIFGDEKLEAELDRQENAVKAAWGEIYNSIASGENSIAYWDGKPVERPGFESFMRYALHKSAKQDGFLQLLVMEIRNGEIIPTSDSQHDNAEDFTRRRARGCGADIVTIM